MFSRFARLCAGACVLALPVVTHGAPATPQESTPAPPPPPGAGLLNDWLRAQSPAFEDWNIGGEFRARFEHKENFAIPGLPGALQGGYGHFFVGEYVKNSLAPMGGAANADWMYVQLLFRF